MTGSSRPRASSPFFTVEDAKASFNLFCCVYGIGTLGMPGNFARAGPVCGTIALAYMGLVNVYASVVCSRVMVLAPRSVKTFADLGEFALGRRGRVAVVVSQMGVCLFVPCAFLVLGGTLLDVIIPDAFSPVVWSVLMSISILPIALIPTLKEGAGAALAGCLGTILADFIAVGVLIHYLYHASPQPVPSPTISFDSIVSTFGNLSLAYGAAIVIPDLQRQHSQPTRMPRVVFVTMTIITALFVAIASTGYAMVGCQIPGNLLFAVSGRALGFTAARGAVVLAFMAMQLHITIGFSVLLHPAFYYVEQLVLGVHHPPRHKFQALSDTEASEDGNQHDDVVDLESSKMQLQHDSEASEDGNQHDDVVDLESSKMQLQQDSVDNSAFPQPCRSSLSLEPTADNEAGTINDSAAPSSCHRTHIPSLMSRPEEEVEHSANTPETAHVPGKAVARSVIRTCIVAALTLVSVVLHDHFHELVDLVGASSVSLSCIVLPILCYLKVCHTDIGVVERSFCYFTITVCTILSVYVTAQSASKMLVARTAASDVVFPYCPVPFQHFAYTNSTHYSAIRHH